MYVVTTKCANFREPNEDPYRCLGKLARDKPMRFANGTADCSATANSQSRVAIVITCIRRRLVLLRTVHKDPNCLSFNANSTFVKAFRKFYLYQDLLAALARTDPPISQPAAFKLSLTAAAASGLPRSGCRRHVSCAA